MWIRQCRGGNLPFVGFMRIGCQILKTDMPSCCFKGIKSLSTKYRSNKISWMTTKLFNEWLTSVNSTCKRKNAKSYYFWTTAPYIIIHHHKIKGIIQNFNTAYRRETVSVEPGKILTIPSFITVISEIIEDLTETLWEI